MQQLTLKRMLEQFFKEDIGWGDLTSQAIFAEEQECEACEGKRLVCRCDGCKGRIWADR